jgi:hypothetical protein
MSYTGGTTAARKCIVELKKLGALVDVYSSEWLAENSELPDYYNIDLDKGQAMSDNRCEGHLLIISTSLDSAAVGSLLPAALSYFNDIVGSAARHHKPDLIFINLATQQILCAGLGRKNRFFGFAQDEKGISIDTINFQDALQSLQAPKIVNANPALRYLERFVRYDYGNVVVALLEALQQFGSYASDLNHLPSSAEQIEEIIKNGPGQNGMFLVGENLMTLEEAQNAIYDFEDIHAGGMEYLSTLQAFFPKLEWADLNTD